MYLRGWLSKSPAIERNYVKPHEGKYTERLNKKSFKSERAFLKILAGYRLFYFDQNLKVGPFYADFIWTGQRVIVEVDGSIHDRFDVKFRDTKKESFWTRNGYTVFRIKHPWTKYEIHSFMTDLRIRLGLDAVRFPF